MKRAQQNLPYRVAVGTTCLQGLCRSVPKGSPDFMNACCVLGAVLSTLGTRPGILHGLQCCFISFAPILQIGKLRHKEVKSLAPARPLLPAVLFQKNRVPQITPRTQEQAFLGHLLNAGMVPATGMSGDE